MLKTPTDKPRCSRRDPHLRDQLERLMAENERLGSEKHHLRAALHARFARAASTHLYGPLGLTADTCEGPRRGRATPTEGRAT